MIHYISIGPYCESANILEKYGRRQHAFPFDFIFSSLPMIRHILTDRCVTFLDKIHLTDKNGATQHEVYKEYLDTEILRRHHYASQLPEIAQNMKSRPIFLHHNLLEEETYKAFQRRCERLLSLMDRHEKIVLIYFNAYVHNYSDLFEFADSLRDYPNIRIVGIADNHGRKEIIHHGERCKVYQRYHHQEIFHHIEHTF